MKHQKLNLLKHYNKLFFFTLKRFKGNNYKLMGDYFAQILIGEVEEFMSLRNKKILDVGGANGEFCKILSEKRKCDAINFDPNPGENAWKKTVVGFADNMPFMNKVFDFVINRGVLEHIPKNKRQASINEMYRVTKSGGICYILIPPWYNPHAGHNLKPFHLLPFGIAKFLRQIIFKDKIEANSLEEANLYPITFGEMSKMILLSGFKILATRDTHFRLHFLTKIPILREVAIPAVSFILVKE